LGCNRVLESSWNKDQSVPCLFCR